MMDEDDAEKLEEVGERITFRYRRECISREKIWKNSGSLCDVPDACRCSGKGATGTRRGTSKEKRSIIESTAKANTARRRAKEYMNRAAERHLNIWTMTIGVSGPSSPSCAWSLMVSGMRLALASAGIRREQQRCVGSEQTSRL